MLRYQVSDDATKVAYKAALIIRDKITENNRLGKSTVLGLATGSTPLPLYIELIRLHKEEKLDFSTVVTFNLDEYVGLSPTHHQSYHYFMHENFFKHVNIPQKNIHLLDGTLTHPDTIRAHLSTYEKKIVAAGGIDIQILGIGSNGHIAFNEPGSHSDSRTRIVDLDHKTRQDNARFFNQGEEVPTHAMTMGIGTILEAKQCLILATGKQKAEIVAKTLKCLKPVQDIPATLLHNHHNTIFLLDRGASTVLLNSQYNTQRLFTRPAVAFAHATHAEPERLRAML